MTLVCVCMYFLILPSIGDSQPSSSPIGDAHGVCSQCQHSSTCEADCGDPRGYICKCPLFLTGITCDRAYIRDCQDIFDIGVTQSGVFYIQPDDATSPYQIWCEMDTSIGVDGGGWAVIQRRFNGSVDFFQSWLLYKDGFGNISGEYWLGNEKIHALTSLKSYKLRIDMTTWDDVDYTITYDHFSVGDEVSNYRIAIGAKVSGNIIDSLGYHDGVPFSAMDVDNDNNIGVNCADYCRGGWWYTQSGLLNCFQSNLNSEYDVGGLRCEDEEGIVYYTTSPPSPPEWICLRIVTLKLKP
ncbi:fibrinogen-like protein A [Saccoglossus kowalevskii]|uniref:Angiopoietin-related protein 1-like n=1 Tax=Saccoglossus kowalevskii TaxID=10224 RepID=A0ABM0GXK8_SACKO|nr:PREDICTED: angiopoietin-related protein 1-like [Saccoglossus kowalevskii]